MPPASILFAKVTSEDQTSNCHFLLPITPHNPAPEWIPTLISNDDTPVFFLTSLLVAYT